MVDPAFILLPFGCTVIYALLVRKYAGYVGSFAGLVTLCLLPMLSRGLVEVPWFVAAGEEFFWSMMVDNLSLLLGGVVGGIGIFVFFYSTGYMTEKEDLRRFYAVLALFAMAMLGVVFSANLFQLVFFWELVGVSSYLLVGFWHQKETAIRAARKAFLTIIVGDAFLLGGVILLWTYYGTASIPVLLESVEANTVTILAGIGIVIGAISKSAQFPLHDWLPDAMEGPTPVSSFLHSATMVKAGLFLIARMLPLLVAVGLAPVLVIIAVLTIIISACIALVETDIKRVLAYSTMNQLAFILLALGIGATTAALFHLTTHSVFKALLFMAAGVMIHTAGTQDMRKMHIRSGKNLVAITTLIGVLALGGVPPFSGFFSKDAIFEGLLAHGDITLLVVFSIAVIMSAAYIFRWYFMLFSKSGKKAHANLGMTLPLPILAFLTVVGGGGMWLFFEWWHEHAHIGITAVISLGLVGVGWLIAFAIYRKDLKILWLSHSGLAHFCRERFLFDKLYSSLGRFVQGIGAFWAWFDNNVVDGLVRGIGHVAVILGDLLRRIETGRIPTYVGALILGFITIVMAVQFL
ncbi:MAG: NADH-quinone oxidoreductase subunit L [Candidatus Woesearchaeota archaeon]|nr:NADH-quinone oxidoreductase subunit L [Candidatus Woesearchaeota archaeon]